VPSGVQWQRGSYSNARQLYEDDDGGRHLVPCESRAEISESRAERAASRSMLICIRIYAGACQMRFAGRPVCVQ
jgi:hypothetical protein